MKIYTKTGDSGETSLYGGKRISKADALIEAYGTVDELNSWVGLLAEYTINAPHKDLLRQIQNRLFCIGAILAADPDKPQLKLPTLSENDIIALENAIDQMNLDLPEMKYFILPGGHKEVAFSHIARTVCRRAERWIVRAESNANQISTVLKYINRLSDYLFVLSRHMGWMLQTDEVPWIPEK